MENAHFFRDKLAAGNTVLGTAITYTDPTVTEALTTLLDFVWIDIEHTPLSLAHVQGHIMATRGSETTPLVRVAENSAALIKPVLDIGAAGVIVPLIQTADDARRAVAACQYPPAGIRGYGPRRPTRYGTQAGPEYCERANASILVIVQIEQLAALDNLSAILAVPGLSSILIGPNDLAAALGHPGEPRHPHVLETIESVIAQARRAHMPIGIAAGGGPEIMLEWAEKGMNWISMSTDYSLMLRGAAAVASAVRERNATAKPTKQ